MAATSLFRELNKRGTIAHNIANILCGHLILYNQARYTAGKVTKKYIFTRYETRLVEFEIIRRVLYVSVVSSICHFLTKINAIDYSVLVKAHCSTIYVCKVYLLYFILYILM